MKLILLALSLLVSSPAFAQKWIGTCSFEKVITINKLDKGIFYVSIMETDGAETMMTVGGKEVKASSTATLSKATGVLRSCTSLKSTKKDRGLPVWTLFSCKDQRGNDMVFFDAGEPSGYPHICTRGTVSKLIAELNK